MGHPHRGEEWADPGSAPVLRSGLANHRTRPKALHSPGRDGIHSFTYYSIQPRWGESDLSHNKTPVLSLNSVLPNTTVVKRVSTNATSHIVKPYIYTNGKRYISSEPRTGDPRGAERAC